jgi:hypothetical protein
MSNNRTLWIELDSSTAAQGRVVVSCGHSNETSGVKKGDQFLGLPSLPSVEGPCLLELVSCSLNNYNSILPTFYSVSLCHSTSALDKGGWSTSRSGGSTPEKRDPVPIVQEAGWAPGPVWMGMEKISCLHRGSNPEPSIYTDCAIPAHVHTA